MAITGDHYVGVYQEHTIELIRDNWNKTLKLRIDGDTVGGESRILPHSITLTATFEHNGIEHTVVAKSEVHGLSAKDTIEIDGEALPLTKTK